MADDFDFGPQKKRLDDALYACFGRQTACENQRSQDRDCFEESIDCVTTAGRDHEGDFIDWLGYIDTYSAITWKGETAKKIDPIKIDNKLTLAELKAVDFDGDQKFTLHDANILLARLQSAKIKLRDRALDGVTYLPNPLLNQFVETFRDYLKAKAPDLYKKAFPKDA